MSVGTVIEITGRQYRVDCRKSRFGTVAHGKCRGPVKRCDWRRLDLTEHIVQRHDPRPIGAVEARRFRVRRGDQGLNEIGAECGCGSAQDLYQSRFFRAQRRTVCPIRQKFALLNSKDSFVDSESTVSATIGIDRSIFGAAFPASNEQQCAKRPSAPYRD
jgi:hypothetical protein